ncbi:hypothetical protein M413DRAFT_30000 [Hebeloma cylindrosporum]|uniref:Uncharacterized protein n=1 Tax=Hebeloma cylindrosporum TaxID=76867 RepID=A0A0C3C2D9_HEBCY|nr:hypothetical protein M413DRAFT_30000 [Hebeloma cylindrosporum h7]
MAYLISIATVAFLLYGIPVHGRATLYFRASSEDELTGPRVISVLLNVITWLWAAFAIAIILTIFLGILLIFSIRAFFMHRRKQPHHLFSKEPLGDARTGQIFCTLVVLGVFLLTAYFPLFMAFVVIPFQVDGVSFPSSTGALTYMALDLGQTLAIGALMALVNHRRHLHFGKEELRKLWWKKILDISLVTFMIIFIAIRTVLFSLPSTYEPTSITKRKVGEATFHLTVTFYALGILDIFTSGALLWRRLSEARIHDQAIFNLCFRASFFFIPLAIFNIVEDILDWSKSEKINFDALIFFDTLINGVLAFYGLGWVLRVYFPEKKFLGIFCS